MKIYLKFDFNTICRKVLEDRLNDKNIKYRILSFGEVEFLDQISKEEQKALFGELNEYGIEIIENQKSALVQKIKDTIVDMVFSERDVNVKASVYLAEKRSEEHTSELQSRENLVCRLLLEKKNKTHARQH